MGQTESLPVQQQHQVAAVHTNNNNNNNKNVGKSSYNKPNKWEGGDRQQQQQQQNKALQTPKATTTTHHHHPMNKSDNAGQMKIPSAWKDTSNKVDFIMISPQSDISNPSHFRGLLHYNKMMKNKTNSTGNNNSKMMQPLLSKNHPIKKNIAKASSPSKPAFVKNNTYYSRNHSSSSLSHRQPPIPTKFYFQSNPNDNNDIDADSTTSNDNENNDPLVTNKRNVRMSHKVQKLDYAKKNERTSRNNTKKLLSKQKFTAKCIKAKQRLSECWNTTTRSDHDEEQVHIVRHYSQRNIPAAVAGTTNAMDGNNVTTGAAATTATNTPKDRISIVNKNNNGEEGSGDNTLENKGTSNNVLKPPTTFQPVWKETKMMLSPPPVLQNDSLKEEHGADTNVVPTGRVRDIVRTFSQDTNGTGTTSNTNKTTTTLKSHATVATVLQQPRPPKQLVVQNKSESIFRPPGVTNAVSDQLSAVAAITISNTMSSDSNGGISRVNSESSDNRTSSTIIQQPKAKTLSQVQAAQRKRASIQKQSRRRSSVTTNSSTSSRSTKTTNIDDIDTGRRERISMDMQRQIDHQIRKDYTIDDQMERKIQDRKLLQHTEQVTQPLYHSKKVSSDMIKPTNGTAVVSSNRVSEIRKAFEANNAKKEQPRYATSVPNRVRDDHLLMGRTTTATTFPQKNDMKEKATTKVNNSNFSNDADTSNNEIKTSHPIQTKNTYIVKQPNQSMNHRHYDYRRRSISVPPPQRPAGTASMTISQNITKKSDRRATITDQSALLVLSKSWDKNNKHDVSQNIVPRKQHQSLPVLLQMAGWKQSNVSTKRTTSNSKATNTSTTSKIIDSNNKENIGSAETTDKIDMTKTTANKKTTRKADPLAVTKTSKNLSSKIVTKKKAKSLDAYKHLPTTSQPSLSLTTSNRSSSMSNSNGRTIAYMLQQAYFGDEDDDNDESNPNHIRANKNIFISPTSNNSCMTIDSASTTPNSQLKPSLLPVVSDQALYNSNFLFDQDGFTFVSKKSMIAIDSDPNNDAISGLVQTSDTSLSTENVDHNKSISLSTLKSRSRMTTRVSLSNRSTDSVNTKLEQHLLKATPALIMHNPPPKVEASYIEDELAEQPEQTLSSTGSRSSAGNDTNSVSTLRRVRFSEESFEHKHINDKESRVSTGTATTSTTIETKMSDLTDTTTSSTVAATYSETLFESNENKKNDCNEGTASSVSNNSILRIDSIPEDEEEDTDDDFTPTKQEKMGSRTEQSLPMIRWSYRASTASTASTTSYNDQNGVTPLLDNRTGKIDSSNEDSYSNNKNRTTSSPYLRFKQAKERFASGVVLMKNTKKKVVSPLQQKLSKRNSTTASPVTKLSVVASRLAAMEKVQQQPLQTNRGQFVRCSSGSATTMGSNRTGSEAHDVVPAYSSLNNFAASITQPPAFSSVSPKMRQEKISDDEYVSNSSPMMIDGQVVPSPATKVKSVSAFNSQNNRPSNNALDESSVVSYDSDDVFGAILHPTTIDDDEEDDDHDQFSNENHSYGDDTNNDEFDRLLNYTGDEYLSRTNEDNDVGLSSKSEVPKKMTPINQHYDTHSIVSTASSSGDTAAVPHWLLQHGGQHRSSVATVLSDTSSVLSAVSRMKSINNGVSTPLLPFREVAPVKPSEQPKPTTLSQANEVNQNTGIAPPRTWRKLAVAAQKQDMKHNQEHFQNAITKENHMSISSSRSHQPYYYQRHLSDRSNIQ